MPRCLFGAAALVCAGLTILSGARAEWAGVVSGMAAFAALLHLAVFPRP